MKGCEDVIWDLGHLYKGTDDPDIKEDIRSIKSRITAFSAEYKGKLPDLSAKRLLDAVTELEDIYKKAARIRSIAFLNYITRTDNAEAGSFLQEIQETSSQFRKELLFFDLEWSSLEEGIAQKLLEDPLMARYRHYLENIRKYRPHQLTGTEEELLAEISPAGKSSWTKLFEKVLSGMKFGEQKRTEEEVLSDLYSPQREVRKRSQEEFTEGLSSQLHVLAHVFNTILTEKMIMDRLRMYPDWLSSMNLDNEMESAIVRALVAAVKDRYDIPARYYKLKKELLGYDELFDYDRYAPLPMSRERTIPWDEAKEIVLRAYDGFSPEMSSIASRFFEEQWIHAPVSPGKRGGAFSSSTTPDVHPYVMVNYTANTRDVQTLAHELGHGVHQYLAGREQGYFNSQTPLTMAETASVFGEMLVFRSLLDRAETRNEKLVLLCNKLENMFATVFRQISMHTFEDAIHNERRNKGELSPEKFSELWIRTQEEMFGDSITLTNNYSIWWCYIPHFLEVPGYVYAYAFGELLVLSLYKRFTEEGEGFVKEYLKLLASGGNDSPGKLLESFGVNLDDPGFWKEGLDIMDRMLQQAEELV